MDGMKGKSGNKGKQGFPGTKGMIGPLGMTGMNLLDVTLHLTNETSKHKVCVFLLFFSKISTKLSCLDDFNERL